MVAPGNPLGLTGIEDLTRPGLRYVNRQRGAGTRVLLDHELGRLGVDPDAISGYAREEHTHLGGGRRDRRRPRRHRPRHPWRPPGRSAWTSSRSPASPTTWCSRAASLADAVLAPLWALLEQPDFRTEVEKLGGYSCAETGRRIR